MRMSVLFAKKKHEVIEHLVLVYWASNQAKAHNLFPSMMEKIVVEMKGENTTQELPTPAGGKYKCRAIKFPDGSVARYPLKRELERYASEQQSKQTHARKEESEVAHA